MNPLNELKNILNPTEQKRKVGKVISVRTSEVTVLLDGKAKVLPKAFMPGVKSGDTVSMQGDVFIGKVKRKSNITKYYV